MNGRRTFLRTVGAAVIFAPLLARAQQPGKVYTLGFLGQAHVDDSSLSVLLARLGELGYVPPRNLKVVSRFAEAPEELAPLAAELVKANPQVIAVVSGGQAEVVLKYTRTIPIVALGAGQLESVENVRTLAKPGGNLTGMQLNQPAMAGKLVQILSEVVPGLQRVAVLRGVPYDGPRFALPRDATEAAALKLGIRVRYFQIENADDLARAFEEMAKERDQALVVWNNPHLYAYRKQIFDLTLRYRLPVIYNTFAYPEELLTYAARGSDAVREAAPYVDKIFRGANPGDLPIGQPAKIYLAINLKTAKALGVTIPPALLARADRVIE